MKFLLKKKKNQLYKIYIKSIFFWVKNTKSENFPATYKM